MMLVVKQTIYMSEIQWHWPARDECLERGCGSGGGRAVDDEVARLEQLDTYEKAVWRSSGDIR